MLYENYKNKVQRLSGFLSIVVKYLVLILAITGTLLAIAVTLLATTGLPATVDCASEVIYGDGYDFQAKAFLSDAYLQYKAADAEIWSEEKPYLPGSYMVRAVGKSAFGKDRFGKSTAFEIVPRPLKVSTQEAELVFGENPTLTSEPLQYADQIQCGGFTYADLAAGSTAVMPDVSKITITDGSGNDVTYAYDLQPVSTTITFQKRPLLLVVDSASKTYDATALTYHQYQVAEGYTLGPNDTINAVFTGSQTDAGFSNNDCSFTIYNTQNGVAVDVTHQYDLQITDGTLTVEKRPITLATGSYEAVYTGSPISFPENYTAYQPSDLLPGHTVRAIFGGPYTDCGFHRNRAAFRIEDENGNDVSDNYDFIVHYGALHIAEAALTVRTDSGSWVYDGTEHRLPDFVVEGLMPGHQLGEIAPGSLPSITDVGSTENQVRFIIRDESGNDVTDNYAIDYQFGTLEVTPRPLTITTQSATWVYDGTSHQYTQISADNLAPGHKLYAFNWSAITNVGQTQNICDISILDEDMVIPNTSNQAVVLPTITGNEMVLVLNLARNYDITYVYGTLEVTLRPLTITTQSNTWVYDGTDHQYLHITADNLAPGHSIYTENWSSINNVGQIENRCDVYITDNSWSDSFIEPITDTDTALDVLTNDLAQNYEITYVFGTLEVTPRPITIVTHSTCWIYNGYDNYFEACSADNLVPGQELVAKDWSCIRDVGITENRCSISIIAYADGNYDYDHATDVTSNYQITLHFGTLEVLHRPMVLITADGSWVYDGNPHSNAGFVAHNAAPDQTVTVHNLPSITDVGTVQNTCTASVWDQENNDVTHNYIITYEFGTLEITPRPITLGVTNTEKVYDNTPLYGGTPFVTDDSPYTLVSGHTVSAMVNGSRTEVGESESTLTSVQIKDASGRDVTYNYDITTVPGIIRITPICITITTASDQKTYDGNLLTNYNFTVEYTEGSPVNSHRIQVSVFGAIINPGQTGNFFTYEIRDSGYRDVSMNYLVTEELGTLTVYGNGSGGGGGGGGMPSEPEENADLTDPNASSSEDIPMLIGQIKTSQSGSIYLRQASYGDFTGQGWNKATPYNKALPYRVSVNYLASYALENSGIPTVIAYFRNMELYMLPYYMGKSGNYPNPYSDTVYRESYTSYNVYYHNLPDLSNGFEALQGNLGEYASYEEEYRQFVHEQYLTIDAQSLQYMQALIEQQGFSRYDPNIILKVAQYIQSAAKYNLDYDRGLDKAENAVIAFLGQYKEGVCRHYASAATLLYRALGIPARYVVGYVVQTTADEWVDITTPGHAWVEVYIDGVGWIQVEVTGGDGSGGGFGSGAGSGEGECDGSCGGECDGGCSGGAGGGEGSGDDVTPPDDEATLGGNASDGASITIGQIKNDQDGYIYLRQHSYGDYTGSGWTAAPAYGQTLPGGLSYNYLSSLALMNSTGYNHMVSFQNMSMYMLPYYMGLDGNYSIPTDDIAYSSNRSTYSLVYYALPSIAKGVDYLKGNLGEYASYEEAYRQFVHGQYLTVDAATRSYMQSIITQQGFSLSDPSVILKIARYIQNAASYSLEYDTAMDAEENVVIAFLDQYKEGICVHYASAATLLYRTLGIPARYVVGYMVETAANEWVDITTPGHAWVEVYIDGVGWIQVEVTGSSNEEHPEENRSMVIRPVYTYKTYDGTALLPQQEIAADPLLEELLAQGYRYEVEIAGSQTAPGQGISFIRSFILYDPNGTDVTQQFDIQLEIGILEVFKQDVQIFTVFLYQLQKTYDGTALSVDIHDYDIQLPANYTMRYRINIGLTEPGSISLSQLNANRDQYFTILGISVNGVNVSGKFQVVFASAENVDPLVITKRSIEVTSGSQSREYDGTQLTNDQAFISRGSLVSGHRLVALPTGSISEVGETHNTLLPENVKIVDEDGNDVTHFYDISIKEGTLALTQPPI